MSSSLLVIPWPESLTRMSSVARGSADALGTLSPTTSSTKPLGVNFNALETRLLMISKSFTSSTRTKESPVEGKSSRERRSIPLAAAAAVCNSATVRQTSTMSVLLTLTSAPACAVFE